MSKVKCHISTVEVIDGEAHGFIYVGAKATEPMKFRAYFEGATQCVEVAPTWSSEVFPKQQARAATRHIYDQSIFKQLPSPQAEKG